MNKILEQIDQGKSKIFVSSSNTSSKTIKEPIAKESGDFFDIEFLRTITDKKVSDTDDCRDSATDYGRLRPITEILRTITDDYGRLKKEAVDFVGVQKTKAHEILSNLIEKNLITRAGQGRSTYYKLLRVVGDE